MRRVQPDPKVIAEILGPRHLWIDVFAGTMVMTDGMGNPHYGILTSIKAADLAAGIDARPKGKISFGEWGYVLFHIRDKDKVTVTQRGTNRKFFSKTYTISNWEEHPDLRSPA